ncbi:Ankyrin repeats (3 copies) [compost metagenome]
MRLEHLNVFFAFLLAMMTSITASAEGGVLESQLRDAADNGDAARVRSLLEQGANREARDKLGRTPLLLATHRNQVEAARVLIEAGADVNAKDNIDDSPYLYAGARGFNQILRLTLEHGADLKSTNRYGGTALIPAAERGHVDNVRTLIDAGVDVNHLNRLHWTALMEAIVLSDGGPRHVEIVEMLVKAGADVNIADKDGVTPLAHARKRGYTAMVKILEAASRGKPAPTGVL